MIRLIFLENVTKMRSRCYPVHFDPLESRKCNVNASRPGKEKHYTEDTSLQAQIQLASSAVLYTKLNAGFVKMQLSLTGGLWFAAGICLKGTS